MGKVSPQSENSLSHREPLVSYFPDNHDLAQFLDACSRKPLARDDRNAREVGERGVGGRDHKTLSSRRAAMFYRVHLNIAGAPFVRALRNEDRIGSGE